MSENFKKCEFLRSSLLKWRFFSMFLLLCVVLGFGASVAPESVFKKSSLHNSRNKHYIARINIFGLIAQDKERDSLIQSISDDENIDALIVKIDSGGGMPTYAEKIFKYLRQVSDKKPVVAVVEGYAASAAYLISLSADKIFVMETSTIGSIGVISNFFNFADAAEKFGIKSFEFSSSKHKIGPFSKEIGEEFSGGFQEYLDSQFQYFKNLVSERRSLYGDALEAVANGRIFNGQDAVSLGLVDCIGMEEDAIKWLNSIGITSTNVKDLRCKVPQQKRFVDVFKDFILKRASYFFTSLLLNVDSAIMS